jgi:hypothetical protein
MQCLKLLILALVQIWTPLRIPKWLLLLSLYEASREGRGQRSKRAGGWKRRYNVAHLAAGGPLISGRYRGGAGAGITSGGRVRIAAVSRRLTSHSR